MTEAAVVILERLLQQVPEAGVAVVHILRTTTQLEPPPLDQPETQVVWAAFQRQYRAVVQDLTAAWGVPSFEGTWETAGFPTWAALGTQLAYWQRRGALAYVACDRPEPDVELTLVLGARASPEDYTEADWFARDYW